MIPRGGRHGLSSESMKQSRDIRCERRFDEEGRGNAGLGPAGTEVSEMTLMSSAAPSGIEAAKLNRMSTTEPAVWLVR